MPASVDRRLLRRALHRWLDEFAACVRRHDIEGGRTMFDPRAYCFGSYAKRCGSLEELVGRQWSKIWPSISGFRFDRRGARMHAGADGRWLCGMVTWRSIGYDAAGLSFRRDGRLTVVLTRRRVNGPWLAVHTHYSLNPGTPQTHVRRSRRR